MSLGCKLLDSRKLTLNLIDLDHEARVILAWLVSCANALARDPDLDHDDELKVIANTVSLGV